MQTSKRINKTKHTVRPVNMPAGHKSRFTKPDKVKKGSKRRESRHTKNEKFSDLRLIKEKMEEKEMRMGGTSVNAANIIQAVTAVEQDNSISHVGEVVAEEITLVQPLPPLPEGLSPETVAALDASIETVSKAFEGVDDTFIIETLADEVEDNDVKTTSHKVGLFGALRLGLRDSLMGQVVAAVVGR